MLRVESLLTTGYLTVRPGHFLPGAMDAGLPACLMQAEGSSLKLGV